MKQKIIVVAEEQLIRETLKVMLEAEGHQVSLAADGLTAQQAISLGNFDLAISDLKLGGEKTSGLSLLKFINRSKQIPVIMMTGLNELDDTEEASKQGAHAFLAKPFRKEELFNAVGSCGPSETKDSSKKENDQEFCRMSLDDFVTGRYIPFDIYVRLGEEKFVKIAHQGEDLSVDRIRAYRSRGIAFLYVTKENFHGYLRQNLGILHQLKKCDKIPQKKKIAFLKHTGDLILESVFKNDIAASSIDDARFIVENTVGLLCEDQATFDLLSMLGSHGDWLYSHSLGVATFTAMIAKEVGWASPATVYRLSMAGLLHDIGLKEVDRAIIDKPKAQMTKDAQVIFESHTTAGMELLSKIQTVPSDIMQIALQHHERDNGGGYPTGLTKNHIQPLARLLSVADEFCNFAIKNPNSPGMSWDAAYDRLMITYGQALDRHFLAALKTVVERLRKTGDAAKKAS